ncbi:Inositol monophosphatase, metal-binding site [Purpureocillium lavendulum]|uniref:Inositol-1-monophosphatase n=1 Tax=Purpureocillium lavendulum TaxID=1247861 RepID=A0AB34G1W3_9HYPO|nr:Inositol monophosphatase, metal-binding site [Purpureocillium lavendulum]
MLKYLARHCDIRHRVARRTPYPILRERSIRKVKPSTSPPAMADIDLQAVHDAMVLAAYEAGKMILAANPADIDTGTKLNSVDIVTEVDKGVEKMVSGRLAAAFPSFAFMGEETYKPGVRLGPEPTFVVDPIDGTTNFVHSFPNACISLGLAVERRPVVGVIYNPWQDLLFTAVKGRGAHMTRIRGTAPQPLPLARSPRPLEGLGAALLAVEWGSDRQGVNFDAKAAVFRDLAASREVGGRMAHSLRSLGSAALNLAAVAAGQLDAYWEGGCWAWDVCAGWCILEEAGGRMVGGNPGDWDTPLESRVYLAVRGAPTGQEELVKEFWDVIGDRTLDYSV